MKKGVDYTGVSVVFLCHDGNGKFLFAKRSGNARDENNKWDIGGGGLKFNSSVEETLKAEIKEEYCADVLDFSFLGYRDVHRNQNGKDTHWIALDFLVKVDPAQVKIGEPDMFDDLGWFSLDEVPEPIHSQLPTFFEVHKGKF